MKSDRFEWDDRKAAGNLRKHKVSFEEAQAVFDDPRAVERPDLAEPDEERLVLTGHSGARLLTVVFTERGERRRIISARKATRHEEKDYIDQGP